MADTSDPSNFARLTCVRTLIQLHTLLTNMQCQTINILLVLAVHFWTKQDSFFGLLESAKCFSHSSVWALPPLYLGVIKLQRVDKNYSWKQMLFQVRNIKTSASQVQSSHIWWKYCVSSYFGNVFPFLSPKQLTQIKALFIQIHYPNIFWSWWHSLVSVLNMAKTISLWTSFLNHKWDYISFSILTVLFHTYIYQVIFYLKRACK